MALMAGQLYEALRAGNVPDDKARRRPMRSPITRVNSPSFALSLARG
jgi:hypothetical protein